MTERSLPERLTAIDQQIGELLRQRRTMLQAPAPNDAADPQEKPFREALKTEPELRAEPEALKNEFAAVFSAIEESCRTTLATLSVAYLGTRGSFTHMAVQQAFGRQYLGFESGTIGGVFDSVTRKQTQFGVVPVENSTEGGISATLDGLLESAVIIQRELVLPISQCLLSHCSQLTKLRRVYSHPQALGQCRLWLATHVPQAELVATTSTTEAAERAARDPESAAIASRLAGELGDLPVVREAIQDQADNVTRFLVIGRDPVAASGCDKTSLAFATPHTRGALCDILDVFRHADLNLTRIESRPGRHGLWEYTFFVDIEGHQHDATLKGALAVVAQRCLMLKVFGSYPRS